MYCKNCGRKIEESELRDKIRFCAGCGNPLNEDSGESFRATDMGIGCIYGPPVMQQSDNHYPAYQEPAGFNGGRRRQNSSVYPPYPPLPKKQNNGKKTLIVVLSVIVAALLIVTVLLMLLVFNKNDAGGNSKETETEAAYDNISPVYEEETEAQQATQAAAKYTPGSYKNMAQSTINLRAEPSVYSARLLMVGWGAVINVTEVYEDASAANETVRWWGKTNVSGYEGWVALYYFSKVG